VAVLRGGITALPSRTARDSLVAIPDEAERVRGATGRHLGEVFGDARPDTLFLGVSADGTPGHALLNSFVNILMAGKSYIDMRISQQPLSCQGAEKPGLRGDGGVIP
jgi:hypothetical protein